MRTLTEIQTDLARNRILLDLAWERLSACVQNFEHIRTEHKKFENELTRILATTKITNE